MRLRNKQENALEKKQGFLKSFVCRLRGFGILTVLLLVACSASEHSLTEAQASIEFDLLYTLPSRPVSYTDEVAPILERRCVVCHGCYDAPCQLKLSSSEGILRGANPDKVYDGIRITAAQPTRLFIDALTTAQ